MSFFVITCTFNPYFVRKFLFGGDGSVGFAQSHGHYMDWLPPNMMISKPRLMAETKLQHSSLQSKGFHRDLLWVVALLHILFTVAFALMLSFAIMKFNFQRR